MKLYQESQGNHLETIDWLINIEFYFEYNNIDTLTEELKELIERKENKS